MVKRVKATIAIIMAIMFLVTLTATTVSAPGYAPAGSGSNYNSYSAFDYASSYVYSNFNSYYTINPTTLTFPARDLN